MRIMALGLYFKIPYISDIPPKTNIKYYIILDCFKMTQWHKELANYGQNKFRLALTVIKAKKNKQKTKQSQHFSF